VIAVLADDLTGAAEVAGVGLRYGLGVEVQTEFDADCGAELVVIDTDTRWQGPQDAAAEVEKVIGGLRQIGPEWIYKKVDSVLRGPVLGELEAALACSGRKRVVLAPANPSLGREIRNGRYFIEGKPIDETGFANDPEYPARCSDVRGLLGASGCEEVAVARVGQAMPSVGIVVGETCGRTDLIHWAESCDDQTLAAGGAEFFAAVLEARGHTLKGTADSVRDYPLGKGAAMFVCTSTSPNSRKAVELARSHNVPVACMPGGLLEAEVGGEEFLQRWADEAAAALQRDGVVIIAIGQASVCSAVLARRLCGHTAALVEDVLGRISVPELYIEGGATASATVRRLRWKRLVPCSEVAAGVVRMRVLERSEQYVTIKPGSYRWPEGIWAG
jgi:uncharacterized protein YgbK (DUF1537 family)